MRKFQCIMKSCRQPHECILAHLDPPIEVFYRSRKAMHYKTMDFLLRMHILLLVRINFTWYFARIFYSRKWRRCLLLMLGCMFCKCMERFITLCDSNMFISLVIPYVDGVLNIGQFHSDAKICKIQVV